MALADQPTPKIKMVGLQHVSRVWRGITTGRDSFFVLDQKSAQRHGIDPMYLAATLKENVAGVVLRDTPHSLLAIRDSRGVLSGTAHGRQVLKYLKRGDETVFPKKGRSVTKPTRIRELATVKAHKPFWYTLTMPDPAPIIISRIADRRIKAYENEMGLVPKDNFACVRPNNDDHTPALLAYMSSSWFALQTERIGRAAGGGALQLMVGDLKQISVPDFETADPAPLTKAWLAYREGLDLENLDTAVFRFLGFAGKQPDAIQARLAKTIDDRKAAADP